MQGATDTLVPLGVRQILRLRYRVEVRGVEAVAARGTRGILFLPNHPGLIDPVILLAHLRRWFDARPLADEGQVDHFLIRWLARKVHALRVPDLVRHGPAVRNEVAAAVRECGKALRNGDNIVLYPAGHIYRSRYEDLRGNSAVEVLLRECPDVRVVLVRTRGLWGSSFGYAGGSAPDVGRVLRRATGALLLNGLFFSPRRRVTIELHEPEDFPRHAGRHEMNRFLEAWYNDDAPPNTYVPYYWWERGGPVQRPEPEPARMAGNAAETPPSVRQIVTAYLQQASDRRPLQDDDRLAQDLGMDSLARADLLLWLASEFGFAAADVDALRTVGDVMLAASGEAVFSAPAAMKTVPASWFRVPAGGRLKPPVDATVTAAFLRQAARGPGRAVIADQVGGVRTYRDLITAILVLRPILERMPGERLGILLPASVTADIVYLAALFAGKVPVMVNWTVGPRNAVHSLDAAGVRRVVTAGAFAARLESVGTDLSSIRDRFVCLEDMRQSVTRGAKLRAWLASRLCWASLRRARVPDVAAVLFTSGSEALPKAVPLTHHNILTNIADMASVLWLREDECFLGMLPPFHSFGLTVTMVAPLTLGARTVYFPNPMDGPALAKIIEAYRVSLLVGTPTFLGGILRAATTGQLATLRLAVTGAERCPARIYDALAELCPQATVLEGYGITECSPVVAANRAESPRPFTIGKVLPSIEWVVVDPDTWRKSEEGAAGLLLVRGPSVFGGYLGDDAASPFVEYAGRQWYRTGDLVSRDANGVLTFRGRLKRFVKRGGEMISLPAVEAVLERACVTAADEGPVLAVESTPDENRPELVLFTVRDLDRQEVNRQIREAGLSPLHNISRVIRVDSMPVLGTGKTDYRALRERLAVTRTTDGDPGR